MPRRIRKSFAHAVPLTFFAIPSGGGALAYCCWTKPTASCARPPGSGISATSKKLHALTGLQYQRILEERGARGITRYSIQDPQYARIGVRRDERRYYTGLQMEAADGPTAAEQRSIERRRATTSSTAVLADMRVKSFRGVEATSQHHQEEDGIDFAGANGRSAECRLRRGLRKLGRLSQPQNVLEFLAAARGRGEPLSLRVFNAAITSVAPCDDGYRYALRLLVWMQEEQIAPNRFTLSAIVDSCFRCGKWDVAHGVLQIMQRQGMRPLNLRHSRLAAAPGETGEARDRVLRLLENLRAMDGEEDLPSRDNPSPPGGEWGVDGLLAAGTRPRQEEVLSELKRAASTKSWKQALKLLDGLREFGYPPLPAAYACAIRACGKAGKWEHALALMDEMRSRGVEPSEGCNVMALKALADAGLWEKTLAMLEGMRASGVNRSESTFVVAMKACGDAGQWDKALALMDDMRRDGVPPMEISYTTAMKACGGAGEWKETLKLFSEMQGFGIPPTEQCFTAAIKACAKAGRTEKAYSLLLEMRAAQGVKMNMSSYRAVMEAHCRAGDWASALGVLEDARRDRLKPVTADLRVMVEACGKAGQHERALSFLEEMRSEGMNLRRTGQKLWWVFNTCRDKQVKERAWLLMEVEETRERVRLRAERNAQRAEAEAKAQIASAM